MALIYFYDATDLDRQQLTDGMSGTDHRWEYVSESVSLDNLNPDTEVLSVFVSSTVSRAVIGNLPRLRLIACRSTGFNNVDLQAAAERDIAVVNVPTYGEATVAEYTFALLLSLTRRLKQVLTDQDMLPDKNLMGTDVSGKTILIVGTGHIGMHALHIAKGFGMNVLAYDPFPNAREARRLKFEYVDLDEGLARADVVTLHVPYLPETHHLLSRDRLYAIKKGGLLVNTARGELVDTRALIDVLQDGHLAGAALDVVEGEQLLHLDEEIALLRSGTLPPQALEHSMEIMALQHMHNVIVTPHNAFNTIEAIQRINDTSCQNIINFWYGSVPNRVKARPPQRGKLVIVRHAESEWNATGQWTGITDVHLSEKGFHEAGLLGQAFQRFGIRIDKAYCSQQIRTLETLEGILDASGQLDVPIERIAAINERDYGDYTGKNKWEVREMVGEDQFNRIRRGWDTKIPGGERLKDVYARVEPFYRSAVLPLLEAGQNVLLVAHGNSLRSLMKYIEKLSNDQVEQLEMLFGDVIVYDVDARGRMTSKLVEHIDSPAPNA